MRLLKVIVALACLLGLSQLAWCQMRGSNFGESSSNLRGIPGYLDPKTHTFTAKVEPEGKLPDFTTPTGSWYYGQIKIVLSVYVASTFPSGTIYWCSANASTYDTSTSTVTGNGNDYGEYAAAVAGPVSSGVATCTMYINYFWQLVNPANDYIYLDFGAEADNVYTVAGQTKVVDYRDSYRSGIYQVGVPTTQGTITTFTSSTRL